MSASQALATTAPLYLATTAPLYPVAAAPRLSALAVMASRYNVEPAKLLDTLKNTVFKNATDAQLMALTIVANEYGLNPFTKEIYAFPDKSGGIVPVVSIDGWIHLLNAQPDYDGIEFEYADDDAGKVASCEATIFFKSKKRPLKIREYFAECFRNTEPWKTCPRRMLRHKTLIQTGRVAFGFAGIHDEDDGEMIAMKPVGGTVIDQPKFAAAPPAQLTEGAAAAPKPPRQPRVAVRPEPAAPAETPKPEPAAEAEPLPGAEPEPAEAAAPDPAASPLVTKLLGQHPGATEAELLRVAVICNQAEPATKRLADVPAVGLQNLINDPSGVADCRATL